MLCVDGHPGCFVFWSDNAAIVSYSDGATFPRRPFRVTAMGLRGLYRPY